MSNKDEVIKNLKSVIAKKGGNELVKAKLERKLKFLEKGTVNK